MYLRLHMTNGRTYILEDKNIIDEFRNTQNLNRLPIKHPMYGYDREMFVMVSQIVSYEVMPY